MGGMAMSPWSLSALAATFAMWSVMMIVMMAPATVAVTRLVARADRAAIANGEPRTPAPLFVAGYLGVWVAFSVLATIAQSWLAARMSLGDSMQLSAPTWRGAALIVAGAWQLTPAKLACLNGCRAPMGFALKHWRAGASGALRMGLHHGAYCLGCCWALMLVLFATGVMNPVAIVALAALVFIERSASWGRGAGVVAGAGLITWGVVLIAR